MEHFTEAWTHTFAAEHQGARVGWVQVQPHDVQQLVLESRVARELGAALAIRLQAIALPNAANCRRPHPELRGQRARSPARGRDGAYREASCPRCSIQTPRWSPWGYAPDVAHRASGPPPRPPGSAGATRPPGAGPDRPRRQCPCSASPERRATRSWRVAAHGPRRGLGAPGPSTLVEQNHSVRFLGQCASRPPPRSRCAASN